MRLCREISYILVPSPDKRRGRKEREKPMFVEKEFYHEPPEANASPEVWEKWLTREKRSRAAHKAQYTKSLEVDPEAYEDMFHSQGFAVKVNGVYKQQDAFVGFGGSKEDGTLTIEPGVEQEVTKQAIMSRWEPTKRGTKSRSRHARRKASKKARMLNRE